jgi:hypothetical protein
MFYQWQALGNLCLQENYAYLVMRLGWALLGCSDSLPKSPSGNCDDKADW